MPDVDEACEEVAGWITPRLGGVGPTTRAMLLRNTVEAAERRPGDDVTTPAGSELRCTACLSPVTAEEATCPSCGCPPSVPGARP